MSPSSRHYEHQLRGRLTGGAGWQRSLAETLRIDPLLMGLLVGLSLFGFFVLYSGSGQNFDTVERHGVRLVVGFAVMLIFAQIPPWMYRRWAPWLFGIGIILLILVITTGTSAKGAKRWLAIGGLPRFQPSEIMKLIVPMSVAWYLSDKRCPPTWKPVLMAFVLLAIPTLLIAKQPDLGTSLLVASAGFFVLFFAGLSWRFLMGLAALAPPAAGILWMLMRDYQKQRVKTLFNPEADPLGAGWNIIQSKTAIGSGGWSGKGWLEGTQSQLEFLPESSTDFIIAVLAEEFGFVGCFVLLAWYVAIIWRGLTIAAQAHDTFSRLFCASIIMTFFVYIFVNIGMVSGLLPVVGVPLPLISYGGTSVVTLLAGFGIVMSVHSHKTLVRK